MKLLTMLFLGFSAVFGAVDINNANVKELTALSGVGTKKAEAIIEYRKQHCFKDVKDIIKVKGLGKKFLQKNEENLEVGPCKR